MKLPLETLTWAHDGMKAGEEYVRVSDLLALRVSDIITMLRSPPEAALPSEPLPVEPPKEIPPVEIPPVVVPPVVETPPVEPPQEPEKPPVVTTTVADIVSVSFKNLSDDTLVDTPYTFGQVFKEGAVKPGASLLLRDGAGRLTSCQMDAKATHSDGSVRHAVLSTIVPNVAARSTEKFMMVVQGKENAETSPRKQIVTPAAEVAVTIGGITYKASADKLLEASAGKLLETQAWLDGPIVDELHTAPPLTTAEGVAHPHLSARFAIRSYSTGEARVDITVENAWAYEPSPQNFTYDVIVKVEGKVVYEKAALTHFQHSRWREVFWNTRGSEPALHVIHDNRYLIDTLALPHYDLSIIADEATLAGYGSDWKGPMTEPMGVGVAMKYMPSTGQHPDIGLLPAWAAMYLVSMDERAKKVTLGTATRAGSWSVHYRDKNTDMPVSLADYPYMTILGRSADTKNPLTKKFEAFPAGSGSSPYSHDTSHQPSFAYLPYLVTGDYYYLEELQFWAMYNVFSSNPGYRENIKGLVYSNQVRGQAWALRSIAEAAYITPDHHRLKSHFTSFVNHNLDWYNTTYTNNAMANGLGALTHGYSLVYSNGNGLAPWQDDFFTSAVGHTAELGFKKAESLLLWKSKFPLERMTGAGSCWISAAAYTMNLRDSATSPIYNTIAEVYKATHPTTLTALACNSPEMAASLGLKLGEMTGYAAITTGYPSNMQPALAYAATWGGELGKMAWEKFMSRTIKPNYATSPQFAITPR